MEREGEGESEVCVGVMCVKQHDCTVIVAEL